MLMAGCEAHAMGGRVAGGTEFQFAVRGSSLGVQVNGKKVGTISSKPLCQALLKCYFDGKSVAPSLKSTCAEGLLERLHCPRPHRRVTALCMPVMQLRNLRAHTHI